MSGTTKVAASFRTTETAILLLSPTPVTTPKKKALYSSTLKPKLAKTMKYQ